MKRTILAVALILSASAASAQDWSGPYLGITVGQGSGDVGVPAFSTSDTLDSDTIYGLFAGYNFERNGYVYGAELAFSPSEINSQAFPTQGVERLLDLKGRFGIAGGAGLAYGVLGYSTNEIFVTGASSDGGGFSYGLGYDYQISDAFVVGGEFLTRKMQNDETVDIFEVEPDVTTFSLRAGIKF